MLARVLKGAVHGGTQIERVGGDGSDVARLAMYICGGK